MTSEEVFQSMWHHSRLANSIVPPWCPFIAAVILTKLGHNRLDAWRTAGLVIGFAGAALVVGLNIHFSDFAAVGAIALCSLGYATGPIIIDRKLADVPPLGVVTASFILATAFYAPFVPLLWPSHATSAAVGSVVGLGVVCTATAFMLFFALIAEVGPSRATFITYINPVVAMILGWRYFTSRSRWVWWLDFRW